MKKYTSFFTTALIMLYILGWNGRILAGDVTVELPYSSCFKVVNSIYTSLFRVSSTGLVSIGTTTPNRFFHVVGDDSIAKFETSSSNSRALLDLDAPGVAVGNLSRLSWRSNNSVGTSKQFGAVDLVYLDKIAGSEDAHLRFSTMSAGTITETMNIGWNRVGIGTTQPNWKLDTVENLDYGHTARLYNQNDGQHSGVLKLRVGRSTPGVNNEFVRFENGTGAEIGAIVGNGSGGVTYTTSGADFAEYLPRRDESEPIEAGDIVGLSAGTITRSTIGTDRLRVISSTPAVVGNTPPNDQIDRFRKVAFIGQVPVKVLGAVQAGDYVVPSGRHDGIGVALAPEKLRPSQYSQIVGVASESSDEPSVKKVMVEVGLNTAARQFADLHAEKDKQISDLIKTTQTLDNRLKALEEAVQKLTTGPRLASLLQK